ncbi:nicotinate-nucleotide adenylyltransferase [Paracoccus siganidrum]|uniref:Probable nicotinate-nucleotide adenylyltransferase n=1 Tax=Paracoccus siganidrum TaxID=1276757 RepID=A0A419A988_9RHOB|nr:nicotinate-nucleotide adenylyltransferase [Paracoccus siganidrum]RJL18620.1 nicotinate-nucleotide adenylyltransferase [Paracoccus siganidrum]RMC36874.1 nicotinic acid mononucleotide adenylyltransferase [Paracoccus siganidrum]
MRSGFPYARPGQRIGLLGGSFDPAHDGHVQITEVALARLGLDRVWWLVSPGNPLKPQGPAPLAQRMRNARRLMRHPAVAITDIEARIGTRMTADTIEALQALYPGVRFVWLMGSDNLLQFDRWDRWRDIAARVPIGVMARPGTRLAARNARAARILGAEARLPENQARLLPFRPPPAWVLINMPMSKLSSTAIRRAQGHREESETP